MHLLLVAICLVSKSFEFVFSVISFDAFDAVIRQWFVSEIAAVGLKDPPVKRPTKLDSDQRVVPLMFFS